MPECPICRREYDDRFSVFVPPHPEGFDSIECAQRAAAIWAATEPAPVILPTIEVVPVPPAEDDRPAPAVVRRGLAALAALALLPGQAALAAGVGLATAGTAASIYLVAKPVLQPSHPSSVASGAAPAANPKPPSSASAAPAPANGSASGEAAGASTVDRPAKKPSRSSHVSTRPGRQVHTVHVAKGEAVSAAHHPLLAKSPAANFVSRSVPIRHPQPTAPAAPRPRPAAQPKPQPTPKPDPAPKKPHSPKPPTPHEPPATPTPATPEEPKPVSSGRVLASVESAPPKKKKTKKSQPAPQPTPAPSPAPSPAPPPQSDPGSTPDDNSDDTRPGNGYGDNNHDHTGPPGHHDGDSSQHGNGHGDDNGNGHGDDHGHGDGNGNGHGHGH